MNVRALSKPQAPAEPLFKSQKNLIFKFKPITPFSILSQPAPKSTVPEPIPEKNNDTRKKSSFAPPVEPESGVIEKQLPIEQNAIKTTNLPSTQLQDTLSSSGPELHQPEKGEFSPIRASIKNTQPDHNNSPMEDTSIHNLTETSEIRTVSYATGGIKKPTGFARGRFSKPNFSGNLNPEECEVMCSKCNKMIPVSTVGIFIIFANVLHRNSFK